MDQLNRTGRAVRRGLHGIRAAAAGLAEGQIRAGMRAYDRMRDLPGLVRVDPFTDGADTPERIEAVLRRLEGALRAERNRARSGHWSYDLNRHIALRQAYRAESDRLAALRAGIRGNPGA